MTELLKKLINGESIAIPVDSMLVGSGIVKNVPDIIAELNLGASILIVSDVNTNAVLADNIKKSLDKYTVDSIIFPDGVKANIDNVNTVIKQSEKYDFLIAVGSGTINDICKYASYLAGKPYVVFGTAPSMNGYSSANASITADGCKKTLNAHLPKGIFLDLEILSSAPARLIRSGLGDSLCRSTAQADWLLSRLIFGTNYKSTPFDLLKPYEKPLFENSKALVTGDKEIMELLANTLLISGLGMYLCGGSYPASQGEHMIAHTMEMVYGHNLPKTFHGEQIGVTTLTMAKIQEKFLGGEPFKIYQSDNAEAEIKDFFGKDLSEHYIEEYRRKTPSVNKISAINGYIEDNWPIIQSKLGDVIIPSDVLIKVLENAEAHTTPEQLGWESDKYNAAIYNAKYIRDRFTFLDVS